MQTVAMSFSALPTARVAATQAPRRSMRAARLTVRASEQQNVEQQAAPEQQAADTPAPAAPAAPAPPAAPAAAATTGQSFSLLGAQQEAINGRAAMLGLLIAFATEVSTKQSVWSQIAGKYVDRDLVEKPLGAAVMGFGFVVVVTMIASFAPAVYKNEGPDSRSVGPFTPKAELTNGRAAMIGFLGLLLVEFFRGNVALF